MLKGIDPLLSPEVLGVLAEMGHGDSITVADANFPAASVAHRTVHGRAIRMDAPVPRAVEAILSLLPLDTFDGSPVHRMAVVDDPGAVPEIAAEVVALVEGEGFDVTAVERFAFYDAARKSYAVVQTSDARFYGCFILRKGVIGP